jgi:hypothetical protein
VLDMWTLTLFVGLLLVGLALVGTGTSRGLGALLFAMGSFGLPLHRQRWPLSRDSGVRGPQPSKTSGAG